jgi:hypothetical protein
MRNVLHLMQSARPGARGGDEGRPTGQDETGRRVSRFATSTAAIRNHRSRSIPVFRPECANSGRSPQNAGTKIHDEAP